MTTQRCQEVQERLPELAAGRLEGAGQARMQAHLAECRECAETYDMVRLVTSRPLAATPPGLELRMRSAARETLAEVRGGPHAARGGVAGPSGAGDSGGAGRQALRRWRSPWGLAAAAGVILALGTPLLVQRMQTSIPAGSDSSWVAGSEVEGQVQELLPSAYMDDDAVVAGAPAFDALSDEVLMALLEEMEG